MNIGQAAKASGVSAKMIRYYESVGLIGAPARSGAGYREFGGAEINELRFIGRARGLGFAVDEIARLLSLWRDRGRSSREVKAVASKHVADLDRRVREMQAMANTLRRLADACAGDDRPDCPILQDLGDA